MQWNNCFHKSHDYLYKKWRKSIKVLKTKEGYPILYNNYKLYRKKLNIIISCAI